LNESKKVPDGETTFKKYVHVTIECQDHSNLEHSAATSRREKNRVEIDRAIVLSLQATIKKFQSALVPSPGYWVSPPLVVEKKITKCLRTAERPSKAHRNNQKKKKKHSPHKGRNKALVTRKFPWKSLAGCDRIEKNKNFLCAA